MNKTAFAAAALLASAASVMAEDRRMVIVNNTDMTMVELYGSHINTDDWEENVLLSSGLPYIKPWEEEVVDWDDGTGHCRFDFKAVFDDGAEMEEYDINVCEESEYVFEDMEGE